MDNDEMVKFSKSELIEVLRDLDMIVVSLQRIQSNYGEGDRNTYDRVMNDFMQQWDVTRRLNKIRNTLSQHFSNQRDEYDMDELTREMVDVSYWSAPNAATSS